MPISFSSQPTRALRGRGAGVTAVLGPTNTGKTHLAIERMLAHSSGLVGLPLRLLAREVYNKVADRVGKDAVALITGEEKIKPPNPRFWVSTVEAMPRDLDVAFLAIDEVQLGDDFERGHVFTDRMLNMRAREETLVLGAATVRPMVEKLLPGAHIISRPRLSMLTHAGEKKLTRLPPRSAIVGFSAEEVYAIAELIRRQRGGAAVVLGALSPRTRNAQVAIYQSGDVDYLVATDAIGMGLNLDVDHVAFASDRKFDGYQFRKLNPSELAQIAGRAGRAIRTDRPAALLGAGGAARAILAALAGAGIREIRIANRNRERAEALAAVFPATVYDWDDRERMLEGCGLLINSTSLGMTGQPALEIGLDRLPPNALVTDIVYRPLETDLLVRARARGNPVVDGLGMLLHQAVEGFAAWFGMTPTVTPELREHVLAAIRHGV